MAPIPELPIPLAPELGFSISHQKVELDIDILARSLRGRTEITVNPHSRDLKSIRLNCRQCDLTRLSVNGKPSSGATYEDPYKRVTLPWKAGAHQFHMLQQRVEGQLKNPPEEDLSVTLPKSLRIEELDPFSEEAQNMPLSKSLGSSKGDGSVNGIDLVQNSRTAADQTARFTPIQLNIEFVVKKIRDGMHFVGWEEGDLRYPHAYTTNSLSPGTACCLFPCTDDLASRSTFEISITCRKTLGDALGSSKSEPQFNGTNSTNGVSNGVSEHHASPSTSSKPSNFNDEDKALDLAVICTGNLTDEVSSKIRGFRVG